MKKQTILSILSLFIFTVIFNFSYGQEEDSEKVIYSLKGKKRSKKLQIKDKILLPSGEITGFELYYLDTTRYSFKSHAITDKKLIKEIIDQLEEGDITDEEFDWNTTVSLFINYKENKNIDVFAGNNKVHISDYDTSALLVNAETFIKKIQKIADWKPFNPALLKKADKIVLSYKNNKRTITNQEHINQILSGFRETKPIYGTKCPFYNSRIYIHVGDQVYAAAPAHDGCAVIIIEKNFFEMDRSQHKKFMELMKRYVGFKIGP